MQVKLQKKREQIKKKTLLSINCLKVPETRTKDEVNEVIGQKQKEGNNKEEEEYTDADDFIIDDDRLIAEKRKKK